MADFTADVDADAVIEFTRRLVRVPSVNEPGRREEPAARLVVELMRSWDWDPVIEPVAPGRPNVHAIVDGGLPGPTLLFEGHTDVVTEGDFRMTRYPDRATSGWMNSAPNASPKPSHFIPRA